MKLTEVLSLESEEKLFYHWCSHKALLYHMHHLQTKIFQSLFTPNEVIM